MQRIVLKGAIIFGVIGFVVFISLLALGFVLGMLGMSCNCFLAFRWSLIAVAGISWLVFWYGSCSSPGNKNKQKCFDDGATEYKTYNQTS